MINLSQLNTEDQSSLVNALNEIMGKKIISEAIGEPITKYDKWYEIETELNELINNFRNILSNKGLICEEKQLKPLIDIVEGIACPEYTIEMLPDEWNNIHTLSEVFGGADMVGINGKIYFVGGSGNTSGMTGAAQIFDEKTFTYTAKAIMPTPRCNHGTAVIGNEIYAVGGYSTAVSTKTQKYDIIADAWSTCADLSVGRRNAACAAVNGKVYFIAGFQKNVNGNKCTDRNDCYDPTTNSWTTKTVYDTNPAGVQYPSTAVVGDYIYVMGGLNDYYYQSGYWDYNKCYDTVNDTWTYKASCPSKRSDAASIVYNDKIIRIGGYQYDYDTGYNVYHDTVEAYDPVTDKWEVWSPIPEEARYGGQVYIDPTDNNLVFINEDYHSAANKYSVFKHRPPRPLYKTEDATDVAPKLVKAISEVLGQPISEDDSIIEMCEKIVTLTQEFRAKLSDKGVILNGNEMISELISKVDDVGSEGELIEGWYNTKALPTARNNFFFGQVEDKLYYIGGTGVSNVNECYNTTDDTWETKKPMPTGAYLGGTGIVDGKIYCLNGQRSSGYGTNHCYDTLLDIWTEKASQHSIWNFSTAVYGKLIYRFGGQWSNATNNVSCYDTSTNSWSTKASLSSARYGTTAQTVGNNIYVMGGYASAWLDENACYDVLLNTWTTKTKLNTPTNAPTSTCHNDIIYIAGGHTSNGNTANIYSYDPSKDTWKKLYITLANTNGGSFNLAVVDKRFYTLGHGMNKYYTRYNLPNAIVQALVNSIGEPATIEDSAYDICDKLDVIIDELRYNVASKGINVSSDTTLDILTDKVADIEGPIVLKASETTSSDNIIFSQIGMDFGAAVQRWTITDVTFYTHKLYFKGSMLLLLHCCKYHEDYETTPLTVKVIAPDGTVAYENTQTVANWNSSQDYFWTVTNIVPGSTLEFHLNIQNSLSEWSGVRISRILMYAENEF